MKTFKKTIDYIVRIFSPNHDIRKTHFLIFAILGIPIMILFSLSSLFLRGDYILAAFITPILLSLFISLFLLGKREHPAGIFRVNMILIAVLLLYMLTTGGRDGSMIHWMYITPLSIYFLLGKGEGIFWNIIILACILTIFLNPGRLSFVYPYTPPTMLRFLISFSSVSLITYWFEYYRESYRNSLIKQTEELRKALAEVKTLRGYLPICASCRKVRDDSGSWIDLETYVESHTDAEISHGLCEDCAHRLYPSLMEEIKRKG